MIKRIEEQMEKFYAVMTRHPKFNSLYVVAMNEDFGVPLTTTVREEALVLMKEFKKEQSPEHHKDIVLTECTVIPNE